MNGSTRLEKTIDTDKYVIKHKPTPRTEGRLKHCLCGAEHYGHYGDSCAVCMVLRRVGIEKAEEFLQFKSF